MEGRHVDPLDKPSHESRGMTIEFDLNFLKCAKTLLIETLYSPLQGVKSKPHPLGGVFYLIFEAS